MLTTFSFEHFRGIECMHLNFIQKNHVVGPNGAGKTHILDMLHILAGGRLLYGYYEKVSGMRAYMQFDHQSMSKTYQMGIVDGKERFWIQ